MPNQSQINRIHETMNDILLDLHDIQIADERSRNAKQDAILSLINMRKTLENMGLHHTMPEKPAPLTGTRRRQGGGHGLKR